MTGTYFYLASVVVAFYVTLRAASRYFYGHDWALRGALVLAAFVCWLGPFTILAWWALLPRRVEQARERAILAQLDAYEAEALCRRSRALGIPDG